MCERVACNGAQLGLLQDWVVFSLPNFIQSLPLAMSTWCLSCFFISASTNPWLRALYPCKFNIRLDWIRNVTYDLQRFFALTEFKGDPSPAYKKKQGF